MNANNESEFRKIDLHIHTPYSLCYSDKSVTYQQIVEAAIVFGLDAIGITDHNTAEGIDDIRQVAGKQGLLVFPGVELTTRSGHFLALFDIDTPVDRIHELLDSVGIAREHRGDAAEFVSGETEGVLKKVVEEGGIVIAAHIERWPSGFLESKETRSVKVALHASQYLSALEITVAQNRDLWENGMMRGYSVKRACIQGSDAHAPTEVGRRPVFVRMDKIGLPALKLALADWNGNIAFDNEEIS